MNLHKTLVEHNLWKCLFIYYLLLFEGKILQNSIYQIRDQSIYAENIQLKNAVKLNNMI